MNAFERPATVPVVIRHAADGKTARAFANDLKFPCGYPFQALATQMDDSPHWQATAHDPDGKCTLPQPGYGFSAEQAVTELTDNATRLYLTQSGWHSFKRAIAKACYACIRMALTLAMLVQDHVQ